MYTGSITLPSPRRHRMTWWFTRPGTNDGALVAGIIGGDEYQLDKLPNLEGWAIDIGAHIGAVALALAADHPKLEIIAVEPVPENVDGLRRSVAGNGFGERIHIVEAAGAAPGQQTVGLRWNYRSAANSDQSYVTDSRYIANIFGKDSDADSHRVKAISLDTLMEGLDRLALLKVDCEGCEWKFLQSDRVRDVEIIIGEFHNGGGLETLINLLPDHEVTQTSGGEDVGVFRADRR